MLLYKILLLSLIIPASLLAQSLNSTCIEPFTPFTRLDGGRSISDARELNIGTYNVLNLEFSPGRYYDNPNIGNREWVKEHLTKDIEQTLGIAKVIKEQNLDIVVLQEVEGETALKLFIKKYLDDAYEPFIYSGNDTRGIDVAIIVKKDLPFKIKYTSNREYNWTNAISGEEEKVFSRDLPAIHVWRNDEEATENPAFVLFATHYKSQRNRPNDPRSEVVRTNQVIETRRIISEHEKYYPETPIYLAGDFNANLHVENEFKSLFKDQFMKDSFDLLQPVPTKKQRITHTFHPRKGPTKNSQLDGFLTNKNGTDTIIDARVYRYKDKDGKKKPIPKTYDEREQNPSDHFPIIVKIDLSSHL